MDYHQPVLLSEVITSLAVKPNNIYIDATLGNGGHTIEILKLGGVVYGIDQDPTNLAIATNRIKDLDLSKSFFPIKSNFIDLSKVVDQINKPIAGILFDLGLSSGQQKSQGRGFSFNDELSLDMRLDPTTQTETAENIINTWSYEELYDIFTKLAQEKFAKPLIIKIISERQHLPIKTGLRLAEIIRDFYTKRHIRSSIDPSTKIFMVLRITVNQEFINLKSVLNSTFSLNPECIVAFITFHSGEDRIIKQFIRQNFPNSPKPLTPTFAEIKSNPLSRSAVLRSYRIL